MSTDRPFSRAWTRPAVGASNPERSRRRRVDFPDPLGPMSREISP